MYDHECEENLLIPINHPENVLDWKIGEHYQEYHVHICKGCGDYWGVFHKHDIAGDFQDFHWFGSDRTKVVRHYY